jgi:hypothetical protein
VSRLWQNKHFIDGEKMKRMTMFFIFAAAMVADPFPSLGMDVLADSEMDSVTARTGVDIRVEDVSMDLEIMNIAWGDTDCGTLMVSGVPVAYSQGYINVSGLKLKNLYMTMNTGGSKSMARRAARKPSSADIGSETSGTFVERCSHVLTIDVFTENSDPRENAF